MSILKLTPSCKDYLWGGSRLRTDFGVQSDLNPLAEAWVLSCHPDGPSYLPDGTMLADYLAAHPEAAGTDCKKFEMFPVLTKFIDAKNNISIQMMGLSLRNVTLTLLKDGKPLFTEQGEALFTHFGISGPLVLSASTYIDDVQLHRYIAEFDLKPALDEKTLYDRLTRDFAALGGHSAQGALEKLLPNSMRPVAVKKWGVDPATRAAQITREQKMALVHLCKHWQVPISELGDLQHAVITAGGVDTKEVDPKTMQSKLCPGLYFAGEVLDVDARTGGYNLQIAWATAQAAVRAIGNDT